MDKVEKKEEEKKVEKAAENTEKKDEKKEKPAKKKTVKFDPETKDEPDDDFFKENNPYDRRKTYGDMSGMMMMEKT